MRINKLELKNFKRFDDLTINMAGLVQTPKLILLIGSNGSGKSSVFDAFEVLNTRRIRNEGYTENEEYLRKRKETDFTITIFGNFADANQKPINSLKSNQHDTNFKDKNLFYGRTSVRQVPKLTKTRLGENNYSFNNDNDRPRSFIDRDDRFENDIEKVVSSILTDVFKGDTSTAQIKESYINPINIAFKNIFGTDEATRISLISIKPPLEGKTAEILFEKGTSIIPYDFLSSGEKEIFNILLNLLTRKEFFQDTVYFLDEIDLHLNTLLQKNLLKEITENWIPENCQLWTASHSLGFIEYANDSEDAAIIDFDSLNFDIPQIIYPSPKKNFDVFEIAVSREFLTKVLDDKKIFFSENTDTPLYNNLNLKDTIFFNGNNKADVFYKAKNNPNYNGLVDRDYLTENERSDLLQRYKNLYILNYYSIENYLYHPDNLEEHYKNTGKDYNKSDYIDTIKESIRAKRDKILLGLNVARDSYPFYRENENASKLKSIRSNSPIILEMLDSDDLETFYKVFPAKDYGTEIKERQNINRIDLAKTNWFKNKIEEVLIK